MKKSVVLLAAILLSSCSPPPSSFVNEGKSPQQLITEGRYKIYGPADCFHTSSGQTVPAKLQSKTLTTDGPTATGEVLHGFGLRKLRPATPQELLSYVAQWRKRIPKTGKLMALGGPNNPMDAAAFFYDKEGRPSLICILDGTNPERMWGADNSFLAVQ